MLSFVTLFGMKMPRPLGQKDNPELRRLYEVEGLTLRQIAEHFGVSHQAVHDRLSRMGVTLRKRSHRHYSLGAELLHQRYIVRGLTVAQVAAELNARPYCVTRELKRHGIPRRRPGTRAAVVGRG